MLKITVRQKAMLILRFGFWATGCGEKSESAFMMHMHHRHEHSHERHFACMMSVNVHDRRFEGSVLSTVLCLIFTLKQTPPLSVRIRGNFLTKRKIYWRCRTLQPLQSLPSLLKPCLYVRTKGEFGSEIGD